MEMPSPTTGQAVETDVLVIGAGLAGLQAALAARTDGARVLLVCSGEIGAGGDSALASGGLAIAANSTAGDDPEVHLRDTLASGAGLCTEEVVARVTRGGPGLIDALTDLGAEFARNADQSLAFQPIPGHSHPRSVRCLGGGSGALMKPLIARVADTGVQIRDHARVVALRRAQHPMAGGEQPWVIGARIVDERDGSLFDVDAEATVLAAGGLGQLFEHTSNNRDVFGSGYALALEAGCSIADLEFIQFTPTALVYPEFAAGMSPGGALMAQPGVCLRNALGERFMERYDPVNLECTTRDVLSRAIFQEVASGRGTANGGVYLDLSGTTRATIADISGRFLRAMDDGNFDPFEEMAEVAPEAHFCMGGVPITAQGETEVTGLFAAGEVTAGMHGANRLNSNALTEAGVIGQAAGHAAAQFAASTQTARGPLEELEAPGSPVVPAHDEPQATGRSLPDLWLELKHVAQEAVGVVREATQIRRALHRVEGIRKEVASGAPFDLDARLTARALQEMCLVAETVMRSALAREESRGSHFRSDFPDRAADASVVHNVARWEAGLRISQVAGGELAQLVRERRSGSSFEKEPVGVGVGRQAAR